MKVVAYSIQSCEKEYLAIANQKKHDITLIANALAEDTLLYAIGKTAVVIPENVKLTPQTINKLKLMGVSHIVSREVCSLDSESKLLQKMATKVIKELDSLQGL
jgi:D-lactate dehydrogenase